MLGGFNLSNNATAAYTDIFAGTGNVNITGQVANSSLATTYSSGLTYNGTGTLSWAAPTPTAARPRSPAAIWPSTTPRAGGTSPAIGTGPLVLSGGTLDNSSGAALTLSTNNPVTWGGNFSFSTPAGTGTNNLSLGSGSVAVNGSRTITFDGTSGTLGFGVATNTAGAAVTETISSFVSVPGTANMLVLGGLNLSNGASPYVVTLNGNANVNITGPIKDSSSTATGSGFTYSGAGMLTLGGASTYSGTTRSPADTWPSTAPARAAPVPPSAPAP